MSLFLLVAAAQAAPDGLQAAVFRDGLDMAARAFEGDSYELYEAEMALGEVGCYDDIVFEDFNLNIPVDNIDIDLMADRVDLRVELGQITGYDMGVIGLDADYLDSCIEFDKTMKYVRLDNGVFEGSFEFKVDDGMLTLEQLRDATFTGDLDSDITWFPDDLTLYYFEDVILQSVADYMLSVLPQYLADFIGTPLLEGEFGPFDVNLSLNDVTSTRSSLGLSAAVDVSYDSSDDDCGLPSEAPTNAGRAPVLDFSMGEDNSLGIGLTEYMLNGFFQNIWKDGYFCFNEANVAEFMDLVAGSFDPDLAGLSGRASLDEAPQVQIGEDGISVRLNGGEIVVTGDLDGHPTTVLEIRMDIVGTVELGLDPDLSSFTGSLRDLRMDISYFQANNLVSDDPEAEAQLARFIEDWGTDWVEEMTEDMVLFGSLFHAYGIVLKVEDLVYEDGGAMVFVKLYDEDDPAVDHTPPDTTVELADTWKDYALFRFGASDDRGGQLAFSYSVDGGPWSTWSTQTEASVGGLDAAGHVVAVVSRDTWLNVDPEPARLSFNLLDDPKPEEEGCGCASARPKGALWALAGLLAAARRRDGAAGQRRA